MLQLHPCTEQDVKVHVLNIHLWLSDKYPMILLTGEVALALHGAVVLPFGLVQDDSHPLSWGKQRVPNVGDGALLTFPDHLHQGAHFDGPPAPIWAHPAAAAAGGLREQEKSGCQKQM